MKNIEQLVHRILSKKQVLSYGNDLLCLISPSINLQIEADIIYQDVYESNLYNDFILEEDLIQYLINAKIILPNYQQIVSDTEKKLDKAKMFLYQEYIDIKKRRRNRIKIDSLKKQLAKLHMEVHSFDFLVLENLAKGQRHEYIIKHTLFYHNTDKLVFPAQEDISSIKFTNIIDLISKNVLDITDYKRIARSEYWRNYYVNSKHNLFPYSAIEYSEEQKSLINISSMYDKIYEHPESPSEEIIKDDDALDGWMIYNQEEIKKQKQEKGVDSMMSEKVRNSNEVFLMAGNDKQQAQDILSLNSKVGLDKIKSRFAATKDGKVVQESELPDVRGEITQKLKELSRNHNVK